jgi:hypothetical protein
VGRVSDGKKTRSMLRTWAKVIAKRKGYISKNEKVLKGTKVKGCPTRRKPDEAELYKKFSDIRTLHRCKT